MAKILETEGDKCCPFKMIQTDLGEGLEFDCAKTTRMIIYAFGLKDDGKTRPISVSLSIDAAKVTKNITHTSVGLK